MQKQPFNQDWRFYLGDFPGGRWREPEESHWRKVDLPHDWSIELGRSPDSPSGPSGGYFQTGRGWYRKVFHSPADWQKVFIEFEGVYMNAETWLNGNLLGRHPYGYTSYIYDLTPHLLTGAENVLRVAVDNSHQLNSRWYSGSGIYRPVWLLGADQVHVGHWGLAVTTPQVSASSATVRIATTVENESGAAAEVTLQTRLFGPDGSPAGKAESAAVIAAGGRHEYLQEVEVQDPRQWSPDTPHLYRVESEVWAGGRRADTETTTFGIRSVEFSPRGFFLNGRPWKLQGGCVHHDNGVLGAASYARAEERKVELLKASGFNAVRCAHNPPAPAFLEACDRLGMFVIDEAFDCWREGKNPGDYHVAFADWWQRDLDSMVYRDRNHPSIILWSIGNEVLERDGRSDGVRVATRLAEHIRALDPTRAVTAAINRSWNELPWSLTEGVFAALDVGGYNYQWRQYAQDHGQHPRRVMVGLESFPNEACENWQSVLENEYVIGDFVWTALDYLGEAGIGRVHFEGEQAPFLGAYPWHQANCGDLDLCGFKRPQSYYRDILWNTGSKLYLAVHDPVPPEKAATITAWGWPEVEENWSWPGREGETFRVDVYSACEQVELFLNGRSLGIQPATLQEKFIASFNVPYEPGELRAAGYSAGQMVAERRLRTAGAPARLQLTPDRQTLQAKAGDLCYVTVEILDADGCRHPSAANTIYFTTQGRGTIAALGSGNPTSPEPYTGNQRKAYRGRCLVVLKTYGCPGEMRLRAQADRLEGQELVVRVEKEETL